jgi:phosphatidylinositol alpha-1,6-mannosyltransferase
LNFLFFATSNFKPDAGGVAELGHQLARSLTLAGHRVTVLAGPSQADCAEGAPPYAVVRTPQKQPLKTAAGLLRRVKPDALFVLVIGSSWLTARLLGLRFKLPVFLYVHGLEITKKNNVYPVFWIKQFVKGCILRCSSGVLCNSAATKELALQRGARCDHCRVLHPGIDPGIIPEGQSVSTGEDLRADPAPGKTVFFTMGRLVRRKGIDYTLKALALLVKDYPDVLYVIAGSGLPPFEEELRALTLSLGLGDKVKFLGRIDDEEKNRWYARQDVFIMPSRRLKDGDVEGFGIVFLEAALAGKPSIGGRSGGVADAVADGETGLLVDPDSIRDIAKAMRYFLDNPRERNRMGVAGRTRALKDFSWTGQAKKFVEIIKNYKSLL